MQMNKEYNETLEHQISKKTVGSRKYKVIAVLLLLMFSSSCSSLTKVHLQQFYNAEINITIVLEGFFTEYLYDLLGLESQKELIEEDALREYLLSLDAVNSVGFLYTEELHTLTIKLFSSNFIATLIDLDIVQERVLVQQDMQEITFEFSKDVLINILSQLPKYDNPMLKQAFFPEDSSFVSDYAEYLAWALGDYADSETIKKRTTDAQIKFEMKKQEGFGKMPDINWSLEAEENTQSSTHPFLEIMTGKKINLQFTF